MNQIAIGDSSGYIVLEGESISTPYFHAVPIFANSGEESVSEKIEITLKGTPDQISSALADLERLIYRAQLYAQKAYPNPQYLRFQMAAGASYYYTEVSDLSLIPIQPGTRLAPGGLLPLNSITPDRTILTVPRSKSP